MVITADICKDHCTYNKSLPDMYYTVLRMPQSLALESLTASTAWFFLKDMLLSSCLATK